MFDHTDIKEEILHVFSFGSNIYGTNNEQSDDDYIVVVKSDKELKYGVHEEKRNIHVYSDKKFQEMIKKHDIVAMECIFSHETDYDFVLDLEQLRRSVSGVIYNSFVKCGKRLKEGPDFNPYTAKKSLFHSLRIAFFSIQIARHGKIVNFAEANHYYEEIMKESNDWEYLKEKYSPKLWDLKEELMKLAPLEKDKRKEKK